MRLHGLCLILLSVVSGTIGAQQQEPLRGFVPVDQLPPSEQLAAAPLLITAYVFVWFAVLVYVWSVWRRMNRVEIEMRTLLTRR
jgi:CcmD family protein